MPPKKKAKTNEGPATSVGDTATDLGEKNRTDKGKQRDATQQARNQTPAPSATAPPQEALVPSFRRKDGKVLGHDDNVKAQAGDYRKDVWIKKDKWCKTYTIQDSKKKKKKPEDPDQTCSWRGIRAVAADRGGEHTQDEDNAKEDNARGTYVLDAFLNDVIDSDDCVLGRPTGVEGFPGINLESRKFALVAARVAIDMAPFLQQQIEFASMPDQWPLQ
ncbi:hypothetical protein A4X09_0g7263 [Tilletia walkeri]|uniref:Uncharacterized protein n=1 Tax=Tilletia walkeri TaxID=117179 RepID=A0A8X7T2A0_9BASI|nr:hypothetical protein A4X09_0g7263 [Tilletia walkeri]